MNTLCGMPYEDGDEPVDIWREKRVTARKPHSCCECSAKIHPGEEVGKSDCLYDGNFDTQYRCPACLILAERAATIAGVCAFWGNLDSFIEQTNEEHCLETYDEEKDEFVGGLPSPSEHRKLWEAA